MFIGEDGEEVWVAEGDEVHYYHEGDEGLAAELGGFAFFYEGDDADGEDYEEDGEGSDG